jgi:hypothetical protein
MTTTSPTRFVVSLAAASATFAFCYRFFWSCMWAARDISGLSLFGSVQVVSCDHSFWGKSEIVLQLDAATTIAMEQEAMSLPDWRRMEDIDTAVANHKSGAVASLAGRHGVFLSNYDISHKGPDHMIVLDTDNRTLTVKHYD